MPAVSWAFGDDDLRGSFPLAEFDYGRHDVGMRIDDLVAVVLDQVGLEHDAFAGQGHAQPESFVLPPDDFSEVGLVVARAGDVDHGLRRQGPQWAYRLDRPGMECGQSEGSRPPPGCGRGPAAGGWLVFPWHVATG